MMITLKEVVTQHSPLFIDVRSPWEFEEQHIEGARNIPLDEIHARAGELTGLNKPIVLYCRSGNRSQMALSILNQQGIGDAYNGGGIADLYSLIN